MNQISTVDELNDFLPYSVSLDASTPPTKVEAGLSEDENFDWSDNKHTFTYRVIYEKIIDVVNEGVMLWELPEVKHGFRVLITDGCVVNDENTRIEGCPYISLYSSVYLLQLYQRELSVRVLNDADEKYIEAVNRKVAEVENDIEDKLGGVSQLLVVEREPDVYAEIV